jgi:hypothetical protein
MAGFEVSTEVAAYTAHPERFVKGPPRRETLPAAVWINPPSNTTGQDAAGTTIVTTDDPQVVGVCHPIATLDAGSIQLVNSVGLLQ